MADADDLSIDFVTGAVGYRLRSGEGKGQDLLRAVGFKKGYVPDVVDATAGLGRDAFLMASHGAKVTLIERSDALHAQLAAALERAHAAGGMFSATAERMTLLHGESRLLLPTLRPDVVLVDPMHPPRGKTALVKKDMRLLREIVGDDPDQTELMQAALAAAQKRVVLKWPARAAPMPGLPAPTYCIMGKSTRYDVFVKG